MDTSNKRLFALLILLLTFDSITPRADFARLQNIRPRDITTTENGYNILAGISDEIEESKGQVLIDKFKKIMTAAHEKLHNFTGGRVSFNKIKIVVPNSWTSLTSEFTKGETVSKANIFINKGDASNQEPEVQQYVKGTSSTSFRAILLPASYVENRASDSKVGKVMLARWFRLRNGIRKAYLDLENQLDGSKTCANITDKDEICKALRADQKINWNNAPTKLPILNTIIVRQRSKRVALIVDVSGSMADNGRLHKAKEGLKYYIKHEVDHNGTSLGIIKFSTEAETLSNLTNSASEKEAMWNIVDNLTKEDKTSIGAGITEGLAVLERHPEETEGAEFVLLSDGEETDKPFINETSEKVIKSCVTVHTIAITNTADTRMDALGAATGGLTFIHRDDEGGNDMETAFHYIADFDATDPAASGIVIFSERRTNRDPDFTVFIDDRIGRDTIFVFECPIQSCTLAVNIDSPFQRDFVQYQFSSTSVSEKTKSYEITPRRRAGQVDIKIMDAVAGRWNVRTQYLGNVLGLTVKSFPRDLNNYPILAFSFWGKDQIFPDECATSQTMYTLVTRDSNPVTGAEVKATIESDQTFGPYRLFDDGKGRDNAKDDGIYTAIFPDEIRNLNKTERFKLKVTVNGTKATQVRTRQLVAASIKEDEPVERLQDDESVEGLQRSVLSESFLSMAQAKKCKFCDVELIFVTHPASPLIYLKMFVFGILEFYAREKNARVWAGLISVSDSAAVVTQLSRPREALSSIIFWNSSVSVGDEIDFAAGLKKVAGMFRGRAQRKAVVLITEKNLTNEQETIDEAEKLRTMGVTLIPVVVSSSPDSNLEGVLIQVAGDQTKLVTVPTYISPAGQDAKIINLVCGFNLKQIPNP